MRVPFFFPKSLWSATAIESIVEVVTPITTTKSNVLSVESNSNLLRKYTRDKYIANINPAHSNANALLTLALCQC